MSQPVVIVIFGATGDLAKHKLFPAFFSLFGKRQLGEKFYIVGFARRDFTNEQYRQMLYEDWEIAGSERQAEWEAFSKNIYYQQGYFDESKGYIELTKKLVSFDSEIGVRVPRVFYLATPPDNYLAILENLKGAKSSADEGLLISSAKVAIEKPFGKNLVTARELDKKLAEMFEERQIYRVDHYLAKETVQNMIVFRFANGIFEPLWNKQYIDHVQITFAEKKGVAGRGKFFDGVGILRDVAQNHLLQLLATVAMEQPKTFSREDVRDARVNAIKAVRCFDPKEVASSVARGQYAGYLAEKNIAPTSMTETYVAMKLLVDTPRFAGVPFYVRAGKEMPENLVEIKIFFIQTCHILFKEMGCPEIGNVLTIRIQPNEGITLRVIAKMPGSSVSLDTVDMKFSYKDSFGGSGTDAYEKLALDIFSGDQMLFNRSDELESSWQLISKILDGWELERVKGKTVLQTYTEGSWGPKDGDDLMKRDGMQWY